MRRKPDHGGRTEFINTTRSYTITSHLAASPEKLRMINTQRNGEPKLQLIDVLLPPLILIPSLSNNNTVIKLRELPNLHNLQAGLIDDPTPMFLSSLLRIEHCLHSQTKRCGILNTWGASIWLLIG
jgi:hypothetical protein